MKTIPLTRGAEAIVDFEDFEYLSKFSWHLDGHGYAIRTDRTNNIKRTVLMHRQILELIDKRVHVDHINNNPLDNRKCNLRQCSHSQNLRNTRKFKTNTSGYKGVYKSGNKWRAQIGVDNKITYIGVFSTKEDAAKAYNDAAIKYHGEFARLNIIKE